MRTRGYGLKREEWYSICSAHDYQPGCARCEAGHWSNIVVLRFSGMIYLVWPRLWRWWANRPNSRQRRWLESIFPRLKA